MRRALALAAAFGVALGALSLALPSAMAGVSSAQAPTTVVVPSLGPARVPGVGPVPTQGPALLPAAIRPTATASPAPLTVSRLGVALVESTASGQRTGPVVIRVACADGTTASFTIPTSAALPASSSFLRFDHETSCTISQGPSGGATLVRWSVGTPEGARSGTGTSTELGIWHGNHPGHTYVVTFSDSFPPTQPTATPMASPEASPEATPGPSPEASPSTTPTPTATSSSTQRPAIDPVGGKRPQLPLEPPVLPGTLDPTGPTVVLPGGVDTNAGNRVRATLFCTPYRGILDRARPLGDMAAPCVARTRADGRVTLDLDVAAPTRVWAVFYAPGTDAFRTYLKVKTWVVRP